MDTETAINNLLLRSIGLYTKAMEDLELTQKNLGLSGEDIRKLSAINKALLDIKSELRESATYSKLAGMSPEQILVTFEAARKKLGK